MVKSLQNSEFSRYATGQLPSSDAMREYKCKSLRFAIWNGDNVIEAPIQRDIFIGRSAPAEPVAVDLTPYNAQALGVSRRHAVIRQFPHKFVLIDLDSTNGTFVNGVQLRPNYPYPIKSGDEILIGGLCLKVTLV